MEFMKMFFLPVLYWRWFPRLVQLVDGFSQFYLYQSEAELGGFFRLYAFKGLSPEIAGVLKFVW
jgi:hypothetical protein